MKDEKKSFSPPLEKVGKTQYHNQVALVILMLHTFLSYDYSPAL